LNKKERVDAALRGEQVDRVPASMWGHDFEREWNVQSFAEAMVENYTRYDWDYMKVNPRACYHVEGWGVRVRPSGEKYKPPVFEDTPIKSSSDWKRIRPLEPDQGALGEQLRALQLINHSIGYDAYFVQTIFCPLGVAKYLAGNTDQPVLQTIREDRAAMHAALRVITETFINYAIACMEQGASGIFYATTGWASESMLTQDQYREFGEQYDLEFLDAIKSRSKFNILHNCGSHIYFDLLAAYPVQALNWAATQEGNPDLHEGKLRSGKAVMGGISEKTTLKNGEPEQVREEVERALELTEGSHFLLAPGCSIPPETPAENLLAIRSALS
jgi:uroporphyrinogen decarboxylase